MATLSLSGLSVALVDPSDEDAIREWYELCRAVAGADYPDDPPLCWVHEVGSFRHPWPGQVRTVWLARVAGSAVGACTLDLPMLDNVHNAHGDILVAPEHRRRGIGQALLTHLRSEVTRHGRNRLVSWLTQPLDPAAPDPAGRFAAAAGAVPALVQTRRRLDVGTVDPEVLTRLDTEARACSEGYSLVHWVDATPPQWMDDIAYLAGRMSIDAPLDDLQWEEEVYDAARVQGRDACWLGRGLRIITTAAQDRTGRLVAYTHLIGDVTSPWFAWQGDTIVAPDHRGHRLGMLIKVANLKLARRERPELRLIDTCNANSNPYMVSINEAMGFRPHRRAVDWQLTL
ncbi:MAG: GNAT family N-acetyltransferase [Pseudonocardiales bacterium]|nr:GNAT family N-acetyltransferase [Pseudonocardiales bacterium]MBV9652540.1 GNAT family N-acetyltransferase [Pseudonocardiales bacterium]